MYEPKYWNGFDRNSDISFSGIAISGIESEKTIEELFSSPKLGLSPIGHVRSDAR